MRIKCNADDKHLYKALLYMSRASPVAHFPTANAGDTGLLRGSGRYAGEGNGTHSDFLAWEIPWTGEPGGLRSTGLQELETT